MFENFSKLAKKLMLESFETIFLSFNTSIVLVLQKSWLLLILKPTGNETQQLKKILFIVFSIKIKFPKRNARDTYLMAVKIV